MLSIVFNFGLEEVLVVLLPNTHNALKDLKGDNDGRKYIYIYRIIRTIENIGMRIIIHVYLYYLIELLDLRYIIKKVSLRNHRISASSCFNCHTNPELGQMIGL